MRRLFSLLSLLFIFSQLILGQNQHPHYLDGRLYVKVLDKENRRLYSVSELNQYQKPLEWVDLVQRYQIQEIKPAFAALSSPKLDRTYEIVFDKTDKTQALLRELASIPYLEYAERVPLARKTLTPNDPYLSNQWFLNSIQALQAHDIHTGSNSVVAIVDDAVRITHEDLAPNLWTNPGEIPNDNIDNDGNGYVDDIHGWDPADNDNDPNPPNTATNSNFTHGTHCAGIVSAATDNNLGVASIGHSIQIMSVKCTYDTASNTRLIYTGYSGVAYAMAAGADVISMSWGGYGSSNTIQNLFDQAYAQGIVLVAAAGNDDTNNTFYPAGYNHVISVAATGSTDEKASFSNYGNWITVSAPGVSILSTVAGADNTYAYQSGTSMATPLVAGLCGLLKSFNNSATPADIETCIINSADNIDNENPNYVGQLGAGRINALQSLNCIAPSAPPIANFSLAQTQICVGATVLFSDASTNGPTSWSWSIPGASPSVATSANPSFSFPAAGTYDVSLIVSNSFGSDTLLRQAYIQVNSSGQSLPFSEDFESGTFTTNGWTSSNPDNSNTWEIKTVSGSTPGSQAAWINFYNYTAAGQRDAIETPSLDFSTYSNLSLSFEYAYRTYNSSGTDSLLIYVSTDCGETFPHKIFAGGENGNASFATGSQSSGPFTPASANDWCNGSYGPTCPQIDLSAYAGQANVVIRFEAYNNYQNNLYLDNIFVNGTTNNAAPIANFSSDKTQGCSPLNVQFSDQSSGIPSSWAWSFPGGNPSSSTLQSPAVEYQTPGAYAVSLIVQNANGTDTLHISQYIQVDSCAQIVCDSIDNFGAGTPTLYTANGVVGYISGHNDFFDQAKADFFANNSNKTYLTALDLAFGKAVSNNPNNAIATITVWDSDGTNGSPGSILGTSTVSYAQIQSDISGARPTQLIFETPIGLNGAFYAGVALNYSNQDTLALLSNLDGESQNPTAWEQWSNGTWYPFNNGAGWGLNLSHQMQAYTTDVPAVANFSFDSTLCEGSTLDLQNLSQNALSYNWAFSGGDSSQSSLENPSLTYDQAGVYAIILSTTGECFSTSQFIDSVQVGSTPMVQSAQINASTCELANGSITVNTSGGTGALTYSWNTQPLQTGPSANGLSEGIYVLTLSDQMGCSSLDTFSINTTPVFSASLDLLSATCGEANGSAMANVSGGSAPFNFVWNTQPNQFGQSATDLPAGNYVVQITDSAGCSDQIQFSIGTSPAVNAQVNLQASSCEEANGSISVQASGGTGSLQYFWPALPNAQGPTVQGLSAGQYAFTVSDSLNCTYTDTVSLSNIGEIPQIDLGVDQSICDSILLDASQAGQSWVWNTGATTGSIVVSESGTYAVKVSSAEGCEANDTINISREYLPSQNILISGDSSLIFRYQFQVNPTNQAGQVSYLWDFGDGNTSQLMNPIYTYAQTGTFPVSLTATNDCGSSVVYDTVQILNTGLEISQSLGVRLYPNPSTSFSILEWDEKAQGTFWLYDLHGRLIRRKPLTLGQQALRLENETLSEGTYLIRLQLGNKEYLSRWVVH
ncbi:MAG: S8 family serine peptidase [Bacteroidota bacterium]